MGYNCWGISVEIDNDLREKGVFLGLSCFETDNTLPNNYESLWKKLVAETRDKIAEKTDLSSLKKNPVVRSYRDFFWRHGVDPTKTRPAGEALARRILKNGVLRSISPIVDAGNLASALTLISIGLYDARKIGGRKLFLKYSEGGEEFHPIGGEMKILEKGITVLTDGSRIIHIYPHRDSRETMVESETRNILALSAGLKGIPEKTVTEALRLTILFLKSMGKTVHIIQDPVVIS